MKYKLNASDRFVVLRMVAIYGLVSSLWIYLSDSVLGMLVHDPATITRYSVVKGILFVVTTALLLYHLIARYVRQSRQIEEELRKSRELLQTVVSGTPDAVYVKDLRGCYLLFNKAAAEFTGKAPDQVIGQDDTFLFPPEEAEEVMAGDQAVMADGKTATYEEVVTDASGRRVTFLSTKGPLFDRQGHVAGLFGIARDITERKSYEQELLHARHAAEAASRAKTQFLANMSHELRTPLHGILGMLQLVLCGSAGPIEPEQREMLAKAEKSAHSLVRIIGDILDLSRVEAGKMSIEEKPFSLRQCIYDAVDLFAIDAQYKGLLLHRSIEEDVPENVVGDCLRLRQVIVNLVGNAIKFTERGSISVHVKTGESTVTGKRQIMFIIADTGPGIPVDKRQLLFRAFSQIDDSDTRKYGGAGLGLAISGKIVELIGGTISFTSEEGEGSSFCFAMPFAEAVESGASTMPSRSEPPAALPEAAVEPGKPPRFLVAEDDPLAGELLQNLLEVSGFEMDLAQTGVEAVEMWEKGQYALIIMDIQMPRMDGITATRLIREKEVALGGHIPIVAMTAHAFREDEDRCIAAGMDGYLTKPLDLMKGLEVIRGLLKE